MEMTKKRLGRLVVAAAATAALAAALVPAMGATDAWAKAPKRPGKPKAVKAQAKSSSSVTVRWGKAKRAKAYQVKVMRGARTVKAVTVHKRSVTVGGLSANTTYKAKVRAQARKGSKKRWGSWSKTVTVRTKAAQKAKPAAKPHSHVWYESWDGDGNRSWTCGTCHAETTKAPTPATCAHNATWELVPGTFRTTGNCKVTYRYCLQCGESWRDSNGSASRALKDHVAETGHLTRDNDGVTHDTVILKDVAFEQGGEPYERCRSCGATRAHSHSWTHVGDALDKAAMGGFDSIVIASGAKCGYCGFETSPAAKWMGSTASEKALKELNDHLDQYYSISWEHWAHGTTDYDVNGQIYSSFAHDHCTVCGLNKVS